ncbi:hypothetical protein ACFW1A_31695 [Kitasatospora sp. NPDC058965]|uniref:hypothetical protein n=1 Tax=Kitasatospora sp. NPDC058965 TaxID=3346682 RepID=UPI0036CA497C
MTDPRAAWAACPPAGPPAAAGEDPDPDAETFALAGTLFDTLHIEVNAASWADLATALATAEVPLEVGDVAALRRLSKLDPDLSAVIARWIRTAYPQD